MRRVNFSLGMRGVFIFDPEDGQDGSWSKHGRMNFSRWYPTAVNMPDGSVVVFSGRGFNPPDTKIDSVPPHEILSPPTYTPTTLSGGQYEDKSLPGIALGQEWENFLRTNILGVHIPNGNRS